MNVFFNEFTNLMLVICRYSLSVDILIGIIIQIVIAESIKNTFCSVGIFNLSELFSINFNIINTLQIINRNFDSNVYTSDIPLYM